MNKKPSIFQLVCNTISCGILSVTGYFLIETATRLRDTGIIVGAAVIMIVSLLFFIGGAIYLVIRIKEELSDSTPNNPVN